MPYICPSKNEQTPTTMTDAKNPAYIFSMTDTSLLVDAINGAIDLERLAATELANRGLDQGGDWVGFDRAEVILLQTFPTT